MILRWLISKTVRQAVDLRKQVLKLLNHQRDILPPKSIEAVESACAELRQAIQSGEGGDALKGKMTACEEAANKWLKPYPYASLRENIEVILVAVAVAMAIRTYFLQPFKIPTGSMQPTLWGITSEPDFSRNRGARVNQDFVMPSLPSRLWQFWVHGISYFHETAPADGTLVFKDPKKFLLFNRPQKYSVGVEERTIWFPYDDLFARAGLANGSQFKKGDDLIKMKVTVGDYLFVDRLTYNFRRPKRGEIIVFETTGTRIEEIPPYAKDTCYIKRLVALGGERVSIGDDRHLVINGERLDANVPHFEFVYAFDPKQAPHDSQYSGHVNGTVAARYTPTPLAPKFPTADKVYEMPPRSYLAMGDNTMSSSDSRTWGDFPEDRVIGRSSFVYWPFTERFGFGYR